MRIYRGIETDKGRTIFATVTGQMADGSLVYTEIEETDEKAIKLNKDGTPKLILDNQYTRHVRYGWNTFDRI